MRGTVSKRLYEIAESKTVGKTTRETKIAHRKMKKIYLAFRRTIKTAPKDIRSRRQLRMLGA